MKKDFKFDLIEVITDTSAFLLADIFFDIL